MGRFYLCKVSPWWYRWLHRLPKYIVVEQPLTREEFDRRVGF